MSKRFARRATCGEMNICEGRPFRPIKKYSNYNSNNSNHSNHNKCKKVYECLVLHTKKEGRKEVM